MRRRFLLSIMWIGMSFFILGCNSSNEGDLYGLFKEKNIEEKYKDKEKYVEKLSSAMVNMRGDGSINSMRKISETGKIDEDLIYQLEVSNNFFDCLIKDFDSLKVPEEFSSYNINILTSLKEAKKSLEIMLSTKDENIIKENAKVFIESNKEACNLLDKVLIYYDNI